VTNPVELIGTVASIATAVGVGLAWWQIREVREQATTSFEDSLGKEYREIAQRLPIAALLGQPLSDSDLGASFPDLYRYVHISSRQVRLRQRGRIRADTWRTWRDGMKGNLEKPAFRVAWEEIKSKAPHEFGALRRLEAEKFAADPREW